MEYQVTMPFRGVSAADRRADRRNRLVGSAFEIAGSEGAAALWRWSCLPGRQADQAIFLRELRIARRTPERGGGPCDCRHVRAGGSVPAHRSGRAPEGVARRVRRRGWWTTNVSHESCSPRPTEGRSALSGTRSSTWPWRGWHPPNRTPNSTSVPASWPTHRSGP